MGRESEAARAQNVIRVFPTSRYIVQPASNPQVGAAQLQSDAFGGEIDLGHPNHMTVTLGTPGTTPADTIPGRIWIGAGVPGGCVSTETLDLCVVGRVRRGDAAAWLDLGSQDAMRALADAWSQHGDSTLATLKGAFAVIAVDRRRGIVVLAVDRFGAMPLAFGRSTRGTLVFGTSADWVARRRGGASRLSAQALYDYVHFHMVPSPGTVFLDVEKLEPAQCVVHSVDGAGRRTYWEPAFADSPDRGVRATDAELVPTLERAVRRHLGPASATFLSGGIDSSTVTGLAVRASGAPVRAFSMGFEASGYDEAHFARIAAAHFGASLRQFYVVPDDVRAELDAVARAYDEPFGNSSAIPTLLCARRARSEGVSRLLAGDGGDELFGGNTRYAKQQVFEIYWRFPAPARALASRLLGDARWPDRIPSFAKAASYVRQARMPMPDRTESYNFLVRTGAAAMFEPDFLRAVDVEHPFELLRNRYRHAPTEALVDRMLYLDWKFTLADNDLRKVGRMCALAGVDVRYPWLDEDVVELSTSLPAADKVSGGELRRYAKRGLRGFLPDEVINKSKHGFGLPFGEWLKTSPPLQEQVYALLAALGRRGVVRTDFVTDLVARHRGGHAAYFGTMVWVLSMLEAWLQTHEHSL